MSELPVDPLQRYVLLRNDPWLFLKHCVFTHDEVDQANPIKAFPTHLEYLRFLTLIWQKYKKIAVPKSRRMTCSWTFLALIVWDILFHKGRSWAVTSKKEEDARELISRIEFIINHIPPTVISPDLLPKMKNAKMSVSPPTIEFEQIYSKVQGFPQGGNQLRQRGFSGIFEDESAFQEESEETYAGAEPTVRGGGRFIKVSSRATEDRGFFKKIVFDQLDAPDTRFPEIPPAPAKSPMEGVQTWLNPKNGFFVVDLHYTANPDKRGDEFKESIRKTMSIRKYRMEYEKSWETFEGKPVYEDFNERIHVTHTKPRAQIGLPLLVGFDSSGLSPAAVIAQLQGERLVVFREILGMGMGATRFVPFVRQEIMTNFPQVTDISTQIYAFFDPAGFKRNEVNETTYLQVMISEGFKQIRPGAMTWNKRVESVVEQLIGMTKGEPRFQIYEKDCPILVAGFKGGFRYPDNITDSEPDKAKPIKDAHSHPHDALQYLCSGLKSFISSNYNLNIPTPSYGFQKHNMNQKPQLRKRYG